MYVAAHGNYSSRTALCLTLTHVLYTPRLAKLHLCACAHPITRVLPCAAHTQRIATALFWPTNSLFWMQINSAWSIKQEECVKPQTMGNKGRRSVGSDSRAYLKETLTQQSFCVAMLCAAVSPRPSKWEAMSRSSRKVQLKTLWCVNTHATEPVRQSALRSQTSRLTSITLLKSAPRCRNRMKHDGDWHIFFLRACILSYVREVLLRTSETTHSVCALARSMCRAQLREAWACPYADDWHASRPHIAALPAYMWI